MKNVEYFKDIPGLEGVYAVSNYGRVWSYPHEDAAGRHHKGFFVSQIRDYCHEGSSNYYWQVNIHRNKEGSRKKKGLPSYKPRVHRLVTETFGAEWTELAKKAKQFHEEDQIVVMHKDNNAWNNYIGNLQIGTRLENRNDKDVRTNKYPFTIKEQDDGVNCRVFDEKNKIVEGFWFSLKKYPEDIAVAAALLNAWRLCNVVGAPLYIQYAVRKEFFKRGGPALITPEIEAIIDKNIKKHRRMIEGSR